MAREAQPKVFLYQSAGFLSVIGLSWLDEYFGLSKLIFGDYNTLIPEFHASILEMLIILGVWFFVTRSTRRVMEHMKYLEGFMKVCAWCRRIEHQGRWMPIERFLELGFDTPTSHGICTECLAVQKAAVEGARQQRKAESGNADQKAA